jgi:hypothetical protein
MFLGDQEPTIFLCDKKKQKTRDGFTTPGS